MKGEFRQLLKKLLKAVTGAICPEVPGGNCRSETVEKAKESLRRLSPLFSKTGVVEAVLRHKEIKEPLPKKILRNMDAE